MPPTGKHLTGPGAAVQKYDVLTALGTFALAADRSTQRRVLRLMTLITARYNWRAGELSVGRREIARMWSVDERTVKREIGALKALGFLKVKRPGARGRVTSYSVDLDAILQTSRGDWGRVGPDFEARMTELEGQGANAPDRTVIPFPSGEAETDPVWGAAKTVLRTADAARFKAWFAPLSWEGREGAAAVLRAPSQFHAEYVETHLVGELLRAVHRADRSVASVIILASKASS